MKNFITAKSGVYYHLKISFETRGGRKQNFIKLFQQYTLNVKITEFFLYFLVNDMFILCWIQNHEWIIKYKINSYKTSHKYTNWFMQPTPNIKNGLYKSRSYAGLNYQQLIDGLIIYHFYFQKNRRLVLIT